MKKLPPKIEDAAYFLKQRFPKMSDFECLDIAIKLQNLGSKGDLNQILIDYLDKVSKMYFPKIGRSEYDA